jgi:hypothetical protein
MVERGDLKNLPETLKYGHPPHQLKERKGIEFNHQQTAVIQ